MMKSLQYKIPYIKGRPLLTAKLTYQNQSRYFEFLVDSGADFTLISKSYAALLGIYVDNLQAEITEVEIANLTFVKTYKLNVKITLRDEVFILPILIANEEVECLLGRKGVFEYFDVLFQEKKQLLVLTKSE